MSLVIGTKIIEAVSSPINGEIKVVKSLAFGTYIQAGGITQSGGVVESIWRKTLKKIHNSYPVIHNVLILGLGGGSAAKLVRKYWPDSKITGVDIDSVIVKLGEKYLGLNETKTQIKIQDAYDYVIQKSKIKNYDLIIVDTYCGSEFPIKFESEEFFRLIPRLLIKDGLVIFNRLYYGEKRPEAMKFGKKLEKVFPKVEYYYPEANIIFISSATI